MWLGSPMNPGVYHRTLNDCRSLSTDAYGIYLVHVGLTTGCQTSKSMSKPTAKKLEVNQAHSMLGWKQILQISIILFQQDSPKGSWQCSFKNEIKVIRPGHSSIRWQGTSSNRYLARRLSLASPWDHSTNCSKYALVSCPNPSMLMVHRQKQFHSINSTVSSRRANASSISPQSALIY